MKSHVECQLTKQGRAKRRAGPPLAPASPPHNLSPSVSSPTPDPCDTMCIHRALKGPYKAMELGAL